MDGAPRPLCRMRTPTTPIGARIDAPTPRLTGLREEDHGATKRKQRVPLKPHAPDFPPPKKLLAQFDDGRGARSGERPVGQGVGNDENVKRDLPSETRTPPWRNETFPCRPARVCSDSVDCLHEARPRGDVDVPSEKEEVVESPEPSELEPDPRRILDEPLTLRGMIALCEYMGNMESGQHAQNLAGVLSCIKDAMSPN